MWTENASTQDWFTSALWQNLEEAEELGDESICGDPDTSRQWWDSVLSQSFIGVLVKVPRQDTGPTIEGDGPKVTEILFYAARVPEQERSRTKLPSPPLSSSSRQLLGQYADQSGVDNHQTYSANNIQLFALPLSSDLLYQAIEPTTPPTSPQIISSNENIQEATATFLPHNVSQLKTNTAKDKKRQRVTELFTRASQRRLKAPRIESSQLTSLSRQESFHRRRGKSMSFSEKSLSSGDTRHNFPTQPLQLGHSLGKYSPSLPPGISDRKYNDTSSKRLSISQTASMSNIPSPVQYETDNLIARNKDVISRVVMAGLRLNGLQPRKSRSRLQRQSTVDSDIPIKGEDVVKDENLDNISDESFKTMYHMVFKATIHTFVSRSMSCPSCELC